LPVTQTLADVKSELHSETARRVKAIIATFFSLSPDLLNDQTVVDDIDGWDSTTHVGLMLTLEDDLGIEFDVSRITAFENVGELIDECAAMREERARS
jgi:acyl carrier protein